MAAQEMGGARNALIENMKQLRKMLAG